MQLEIKYPCGFELDYRGCGSLGLEFDFDDGCPIHGKNCFKNKKWSVKK